MRMGLKWLGGTFLVACLWACAARAQVADTDLWVTSGPVRAMARIGDTLYVGGNFLRVSPSHGGWVPTDPSTGAPTGIYPKVRGSVHTAIPDGSGGWFLGGGFDRIGTTAVRNLAHVLADGSLQTLPTPDSTVYSLFRQGRSLYLGGEFRSVGDSTRRRLAAIDIVSGDLLPWDPGASRAVYAMAIQGTTTLFVAGQFDSLGGVTRAHVGSIDAVSGAVNAWSPSLTSTYNPTGFVVRSLVVKDGLVYAGGEFNAVGGTARNGAAAIDATTGAVTAWVPGLGTDLASVYTLIVDTTLVYVGGRFTNSFGDYGDVVALDRTTGAATSWEQYFDRTVRCMARSGLTLYVGGEFEDTRWGSFDGAVALDLSTGEAGTWNPAVSGTVTDIDIDGATVRLAGGFLGLGDLHRRLLAAFDLNTGLPTSWAPGPDLPVYAMTVTPAGKLAVAGAFTSVDGMGAPGIALLDPITGAPEPWDPQLENASSPYRPSVSSLAIAGNTLYAGGSFTSAGGAAHKNLVALDLTTATPKAWDANASGPVLALAPSPVGLLVGGNFGTIGGATRHALACIDTATGLATAWDPDVDLLVRALAVQGSTAYVGGSFSWMGTERRFDLAAVDLGTGLPTAWNPNVGGGSPSGHGVYSLLPLGTSIVAGGDFNLAGGAVRHDLAALDISTASATGWNPDMSDPSRSTVPLVYSVLGHEGRILAGGSFVSVGDELQARVTSIDSPPVPNVGWCNLQWPPTLTALPGVASELVYGRVWLADVTPSTNHDTRIEAELGWGPHGSLPTEPSWVWTPAAFNLDYTAEDEHMARLTIPVAGTYDYAYRFRYRWSDWTYGDLDGSGNGYAPVNAGLVTVAPMISNSIVQWPPFVFITLGAATPTIYGRLWGAGITDAPGAAADLVAQVGYGPDGTDPASSGAWTWVSATYDLEVDGGGEQYKGSFTPSSVGVHDYAYRFSYLGGAWLYTDLDGSWNGYQLDQAGTLDVSVAGVDEAAPRVLSFALAGANPVRGDASFRLGLPSAGSVTLEVFDAAGRQVAKVAPGTLPAGWHALRWASAEAAPGVYVVRLSAAGTQRVARLAVLR